MTKIIDPTPESFLDVLKKGGICVSNEEEFIAEANMRRKDRETVTDEEKRFRELLEKYDRPGTERLFDILKMNDFFVVPASVDYHNNFKGGLVKHSLEVYDCAMREREILLKNDPSLENELTEEAVTVAALLHDVCKYDEYTIYPDGVAKHKKGHFPIGGHGDKSVILLLHWGFELKLDEMLAIKWHMGKKHLTDKKDIENCSDAMKLLALCRVIAKADYEATHNIENVGRV